MAQRKNQGRDFVARIVIYDLPSMDEKQLGVLGAWLRQLANVVEKPEQYSKVFTSKLMK